MTDSAHFEIDFAHGPHRGAVSAETLAPFLRPNHWVDSEHPAVIGQALALAEGCAAEVEVAARCFAFVRDAVRHSWDHRANPVTCAASEALAHRTGYCYAKSHLLAALLRANGIAAGLCYQRLSVGDAGAPYCLHGLNAVYLKGFGWYRCDARGNKPGVDAQFSPPDERLAFRLRDPEEAELPGIYAAPWPEVVALLTQSADVAEVLARLPEADAAWRAR
ncbi:MAG: transglutaminase family protein [Myxococcales bacterium]|nr:transglutaminase family protein [Myxococcales bacterium]